MPSLHGRSRSVAFAERSIDQGVIACLIADTKIEEFPRPGFTMILVREGDIPSYVYRLQHAIGAK